jgi:LmbE family N-acetylglucosaminyl deacetylase
MVEAGSALVVAPHYDDEILGCGGLIAGLAAGGAAVRVLFLSDGGGGGEEIADREAYRRRRREEAAGAAALLGLAGWDGLALPDGALDRHLEAAVAGIRRALLSQRPDLLLVPSPLEISRDHRAAFAAVHRLFAPVRVGALEHEAWEGLRILAYEVNHPAYPDLLVDVSAHGGLLERAMALYASQEERHPYGNAALGLRRFRTLSLGARVALAEGYRRLALADFTTRSPAQLVAFLGGAPEPLVVSEGPKVSVVVRTKDRPELLAQALASLAASDYRRAEVVLVNSGGGEPAVPDGFPLPVVRAQSPAERGRAGSVAAGIAAATGDYVTFLDDDDLAAPEHLSTLAGLVQGAGVRVAYTDAAVTIWELVPPSGWVCRERRLPYSRDFDPDLLLVDNYIPFNTLLIERALLLEVGPPDLSLPFFEDWDLLIRLAALAPFHHLPRVTCEYRHFRGGGHHIFGERPRERGDFLAVKAQVLGKHAARLTPEALARAVDLLRAELVAEREATAGLKREVASQKSDLDHRGRELATLGAAHQALAGERFAWEERYHARNGEAAALERAQAQATADLHRLYAEEARLRAAVDEQNTHLGRTYAEIERLNGLVREMESTRTWRIHQAISRRR